MSQYDFGNLESPLPGSTFINTHLEPWRNALHSMHAGNARPSYAQAKMLWINDTTTPWVLNCFDGADDIALGTINATTNVFTPAGIGSVVQGYNANLASLAGLTLAANKGLYSTGASTVAMYDLTAAGRELINDADAAAQRTTLGLGTSATVNTGTSGGTIPLLNGVNTFSGVNRFSAGLNPNSAGGQVIDAFLDAQTWVPTVTNVENIDSVTLGTCYYTQIGDTVFFWGSATVDATAAGPNRTTFAFSPPVASNFGSFSDAGGSIAGGVSGGNTWAAGRIYALSTSDRLELQYAAVSTAAIIFTFNGSYKVI